MMSTDTQKHFQWVAESAIVLIIVGVGLNFLVMQTLGSFDAAWVILALFVGFWAFVLGNTVAFLSSIWLFMRRRDISATSVRAIREPAPVDLEMMGQRQRCMGSC